jgi:hypothetical protein
LGEVEQRFHGGQRAILGGGTSLPQALGPGLEIGEGDGSEGFPDELQEPPSLKAVRPPGMGAGLQGEPEGDQTAVRSTVEGRRQARSADRTPENDSREILTQDLMFDSGWFPRAEYTP